MAMSSRSTIVGVFRDQTMAEQALNALTSAGFTNEQIRYSGTSGGSSSFFGDLKSLFTGEGATNGTFTQDMADMGLSDEEARFYENESRNGNRVLAVKAPGREQDAMGILQQYGAYNHTVHNANTNAARTPNYTQPVAATAVNASQVARQQDTHYGQPPTNRAQVDAERTARREQLAQEETVKENRDNLQTRAQSPQMPPQMPQTAQAQSAPSPIAQENQGSSTAANSDTQLQSMQAQLQALQQQIRDTHTQLERTKQREAQLQATRMRDTRMHELQKQLQEAQAQLQAAQQELQASQARVDQLGR